jgi:hypothetical protein
MQNNYLKQEYILKMVKKSNFNTIKYKTLLAISKDKKCTYTSIQKHVLISQGKDPKKDYKRGYYCTNICYWKHSNIITKKGKYYRLTSLGKLYLKDPQKANDKIRISNLLHSRDLWRSRANELYYNNTNKRELKELREENYNLSYKLNEVRKAIQLLKDL